MATITHGIYGKEQDSGLTVVNTSAVGVPVIVGTASGFGASKKVPINELKLIKSWEEYVSAFGYAAPSEKIGDLKKHAFTLDEFAYAFFRLYNGEAAVFANVLDPDTHKKESEAVKTVTFDEKRGRAVFNDLSVIPNSLSLSYKATPESEEQTFVFNEDFKVFVDGSTLYLQNVATGDSGWKIPVGKIITVKKYEVLAPEKVTTAEIIGTYNAQTGKRSGLELTKQVFQQFRQVPGILAAPHFSKVPSVALALSTLADNIEGVFRGIAVADLPTGVETVGGNELQGPAVYSDAYTWKTDKGLNNPNLILCWPACALDNVFYDLSCHLIGTMISVDAEQGGYPNASPSNHEAKINSLRCINGDSVWLTVKQANDLNPAAGIVTCLNFLNWAIWGNRNSAYPEETDPSKNMIPNVRTIRWLLNSLVLNYWSKVDMPVKRVNIEALINSINSYLNRLQNDGVILGAKVTFNSADNPTEDMVNGKFRIRLRWCGTPPMETLEILTEYDATYLSTLFA